MKECVTLGGSLLPADTFLLPKNADAEVLTGVFCFFSVDLELDRGDDLTAIKQ